MSLADVSATTKFVKAITKDSNISVQFVDGLKVPYATPAPAIFLPPPTIKDLLDWRFQVHHELSHCLPANSYHWKAVKAITKGKTVLNILVDNLAERHEYRRYEGRKVALCQGRYEFLMSEENEWFTHELVSKEDEVISGLIAWDCLQRQSWMGYPMSKFYLKLEARAKFASFFKYCEKIELERLMLEHDTYIDIVDMTYLVLDYVKENEEDDDKGSEPDTEKKDDGEESGSGDRPDGDDDSGSCLDLPGMGGELDDTGGEECSPSEDGDLNSGDSGDGESCLGDAVEWSDENVSEETKDVSEKFTMEGDRVPVPPDRLEYTPITNVSWIPLAREPDVDSLVEIGKMVEKSKMGKAVQKHLTALTRTSYSYGHKSGRLAVKAAYGAPAGRVNIFRKKGATRLQKSTAFQLVVDFSGSMRATVDERKEVERIHVAMASAYLLGSTLKKVGIPYEIIGFTHSLGIKMCEVKGFREEISSNTLMNRCASTPHLMDNADAESILEAASRLVVRLEEKKIMIVLSDGCPQARFRSSTASACRYLKEVCSHIEDKTDISLFSLGIDTHTVSRFYKNYEVVSHPMELDQKLMKLLTKELCVF